MIPNEAAASGSRWKNAPPNRDPAEKLMKNTNTRLRSFPLSIRERTPTNDIRLTMTTLMSVGMSTISLQSEEGIKMYAIRISLFSLQFHLLKI